MEKVKKVFWRLKVMNLLTIEGKRVKGKVVKAKSIFSLSKMSTVLPAIQRGISRMKIS